jgi:hypothetical protein
MSTVHNPQEKKRLSYERDHYNRNGENNKSWRKAKPIKKKKAVKSFRKSSNDLTKVVARGDAPMNAEKKLGSLKQKKVVDWGSIRLGDFVANRKEMRATRVGSRKRRQKTEPNQTPEPTAPSGRGSS